MSFHHSISVQNCIDFLVINEEKLVALLVYFSFRLVATSGIRNSSVATSSSSWIRQAVLRLGVNTKLFRIPHSTEAEYS